ncbi:hypothetical protein YC2023_065914 [Brassica napus]
MENSSVAIQSLQGDLLRTDSWDPAVALEQYKTVKTTEVELLGLPAPSFNDEHEILWPAEAEKTPEPTDDDPPAE